MRCSQASMMGVRITKRGIEMTDREIKEFVRDRDKAVKETIEKQDLDVFKGFYVRYMLKYLV